MCIPFKRRMLRGIKHWKPTFHLVFIIITSYFISQRNRKIINSTKITKYRTDMRHILLWTKIPSFDDDGQTIFLRRKCHHYNCYVISNRTFLSNLGHYDAILFNLQDVSAGGNDLPEIRSFSQKYIFVANDSSDNYPVCDSVYDTFFNWTWSYRQDSTIAYRHLSYRNTNDDDLSFAHFKWITRMNPISQRVQSELTSKYKAAAVFMDKCKSRSKREVYIKHLQQHLSKFNMTVDIFGECGQKKCKRKTMANCFWRLKHQYYFYLAMEDSFATDYLTKEVLYAYQNYAVPIVYGGAAYAKYLPPHSYLNANDITEEQLATVIKEAIDNKTIYHNFFRWRNHYKIYESQGMNACSLCKALNNPHWLSYNTNHNRFRKWWNPLYETHCAKTYGMTF